MAHVIERRRIGKCRALQKKERKKIKSFSGIMPDRDVRAILTRGGSIYLKNAHIHTEQQRPIELLCFHP